MAPRKCLILRAAAGNIGGINVLLNVPIIISAAEQQRAGVMPLSEETRSIVGEATNERWRFRRVRLPGAGRVYIPATSEEVIGSVQDISVGGATISCELTQRPYGQAVIYVGGLGRLEGEIVRVDRGGFTMTFSCSREKRERLADMLTVELNRHLLDRN